MKILIISVVLLSYPQFIQSLRFGLLRIVESNVGSATKQSPVADFRSLFDEDVKFNFRGLLGEDMSLSLSMSFPLPRNTPSPIFRNPTAVPTVSIPPSFTVSPSFTLSPVSAPTSSPAVNDTTITNTTVASDEAIAAAASNTGNVITPVDSAKTSRNIAMIVVASCAMVALVAIVAKKISSSSSKRSSSLPKGAATITASINDSNSSSNDVSSVGSTSVSGMNLMGNTHSNTSFAGTAAQI